MTVSPQPHLFRRLIKNNIFRLSLLYTLLFFIASLSMLGVAYFTIDKNIQTSIEKEVNAEISRFVGSYQSNKLGIETEPYAFLIEQDGTKLAGNISEIPGVSHKFHQLQEEGDGKLMQIDADTVVDRDSKIEKKGHIIGKAVTLPDQTTLFIGKNSYDQTERRKDILDALSTALLTLIAVGFIGGMVISYQSIKRIDRISQVSKSIVDGHINLRIPSSRQNDDISDLGSNINEMLDRMNVLMQNAKQVSNHIAHDLRTPLTRLRANIETIANKTDGELQVEADKALAETDNLLDTFTSILRISQVESRATDMIKQPVNVSDVVAEVMDLYDVLAEEKQQSVRLELESDITVLGDKQLISQALANLFTNAVKYTPEKGNILIQLMQSKKTGMTRLIVHDSGAGVPESEVDKLTQRFYRLEKHRDTANGNGLGLTMVKAIMQAHQGDVQFENSVGLKVTLYFPKN